MAKMENAIHFVKHLWKYEISSHEMCLKVFCRIYYFADLYPVVQGVNSRNSSCLCLADSFSFIIYWYSLVVLSRKMYIR